MIPPTDVFSNSLTHTGNVHVQLEIAMFRHKRPPRVLKIAFLGHKQPPRVLEIAIFGTNGPQEYLKLLFLAQTAPNRNNHFTPSSSLLRAVWLSNDGWVHFTLSRLLLSAVVFTALCLGLACLLGCCGFKSVIRDTVQYVCTSIVSQTLGHNKKTVQHIYILSDY